MEPYHFKSPSDFGFETTKYHNTSINKNFVNAGRVLGYSPISGQLFGSANLIGEVRFVAKWKKCHPKRIFRATMEVTGLGLPILLPIDIVVTIVDRAKKQKPSIKDQCVTCKTKSRDDDKKMREAELDELDAMSARLKDLDAKIETYQQEKTCQKQNLNPADDSDEGN